MEDVQFFKACFIRYTCFSSFRQIVSIKNLFRCLLLIVTVRFISFPLSFIVSVVSVEDFQFFQACFIRYTCFSSFRQIVSIKNLLEDACYFLLQSVSAVFYSFSLFQLFQWKMSNFLSPFHSLHLFHQFQADCVYKKSLGRCL